MPTTWSLLKKQILDRISPCVRERINLGYTTYPGEHDRGWLSLDKQEILLAICGSCARYRSIRIGNDREDPNPGYGYDPTIIWEIVPGNDPGAETLSHHLYDRKLFWFRESPDRLNLFSADDFTLALRDYLDLSIGEILLSVNPVIRAMGMLDSRVGKRRLRAMDMSNDHELVKTLYCLRCTGETIPRPSTAQLTSIVSNGPWPWSEKEVVEKHSKSAKAEARLQRSNQTRKLGDLISRIHRGTISREEMEGPAVQALFDAFEKVEDPDRLCHAFKLVDSRSKLLKSGQFVPGLAAVLQSAHQGVRPIVEWKPDTYNAARQFSSLARHLWAVHEVPIFMDRAWLSGDDLQQDWFRHIGAGGSIRTANALPVSLTKKMAHHFHHAPDDYPILAAFRWGQVHALGGDRQLADALVGTRISDDFRDDPFALNVIRFFIANPMLDPVHIGPILDYIWNRRYEPRIVFNATGERQELGPEQPNFSMRGRTADAMLRAVERWHAQLGKSGLDGGLTWTKSSIPDVCFKEGSKENKPERIWRFRELLSIAELQAEGKEMRHCVASYAQSCHRGICSIWTLVLETPEGCTKCLTIEVQNKSMKIRQARGKSNRLCTDREKVVLAKWAQQAGLGGLGSYIA